MIKHIVTSVAISAAALAVSTGEGRAVTGSAGVSHVLLISIDGMHALDFINCATASPVSCPNLASLKANGVNYLQASASKPSDSFPGLTAIVSGGSPRTEGAFYDVAYDRVLAPPQNTTGNGLAGGACRAGAPNGTGTEYEEGIDLDQSKLNGGAPPPAGPYDGGIASIDPTRLVRDPFNQCQPVWPWNFVRTNTIFSVIHQAGGYVAWSDKHPSYSSVAGPSTIPGPAGSILDDYYSPEINSVPINLPVTLPIPVTTANGAGVAGPTTTNCTPLPDASALTSDYTNSFTNIQCYDQLKANAIINQINGLKHNGLAPAPVPNLFGMNFQSVSVNQKLIEKTLHPVVKGGYLDNVGTPSTSLAKAIKFVDASIGQMITALKTQGLYNSTLIVITAKHGQSPVDSSRYLGINIAANGNTSPITTSPATILANCLTPSQSSSQIGPTEDDVSLLWLTQAPGCTTTAAVSNLEAQSPATSNIAGIGQIFSGNGIAQMFNPPGLPSQGGDPRTPDIIVTPDVGVTYSGSSKKQAEHSGFSHDDTNVILLLSNPRLNPVTVITQVETAQIAPTILQTLGLNPSSLQAVQIEGTQVLPSVNFNSAN